MQTCIHRVTVARNLLVRPKLNGEISPTSTPFLPLDESLFRTVRFPSFVLDCRIRTGEMISPNVPHVDAWTYFTGRVVNLTSDATKLSLRLPYQGEHSIMARKYLANSLEWHGVGRSSFICSDHDMDWDINWVQSFFHRTGRRVRMLSCYWDCNSCTIRARGLSRDRDTNSMARKSMPTSTT